MKSRVPWMSATVILVSETSWPPWPLFLISLSLGLLEKNCGHEVKRIQRVYVRKLSDIYPRRREEIWYQLSLDVSLIQKKFRKCIWSCTSGAIFLWNYEKAKKVGEILWISK